MALNGAVSFALAKKFECQIKTVGILLEEGRLPVVSPPVTVWPARICLMLIVYAVAQPFKWARD